MGINNIVFSIIGSAINKKNYKRCYNYIKNTDVSFEMIFVGSHPPTEFIGEHFNYIYSTVKPAQCIEIGARMSQGEYIIPTYDDCYFSENFLDNLWEQIQKIDTTQYLLSFYSYPGFYNGEPNLKLWKKVAPLDLNYFGIKVGECCCFPREVWTKLGGIDRRFIWSFPIVDLQLRCFEIGLILQFVPNIYVQEIYERIIPEKKNEYDKNKLSVKYGDYDRRMLYFFWNDVYGGFSPKRRLPVESFNNGNIKTVTQGEKGEWN